ncbi:MAG TPA: hypothetical protein VG733_05095 [Chthoniobacteraceae bacterium]|nr:hypothetical protein [Chthoniobacteraceae bacterium]
MAGNRRRHTNSVQVGALLKWIVAAAFLAITGLGYVYVSNGTQRSGDEIKKLENQLKELQAKNEACEKTIAQLSSYKELQDRLKEGFITMQPITEDHIVRVNVPRHSPDEIRVVANRGTEK